MDIQTLLTAIINFLNDIFIPVLFGIAILFFLWNVARYFIIGGANEDDREKARSLATWGVLAFVVITAFWGLINLIGGSLGIDSTRSILPDYMCEKIYKGERPCDDANIIDPNDANNLDGFTDFPFESAV